MILGDKEGIWLGTKVGRVVGEPVGDAVQFNPIQVFAPDVSGHPAPNANAPVWMERVRVVFPCPQSSEQASQSDQGVITQSPGHSSVLQTLTSSVMGHSAPAPDWGVQMLRTLCRTPPPQLNEQIPQVNHAVTKQFTGRNDGSGVGVGAGEGSWVGEGVGD